MNEWKIVFSEQAVKQFSKLDRYTQTFIHSWIIKHLKNVIDPRKIGKPLVGNHKGKWRYRVGDYRLLCQIIDNEITIIIITVGHRKEVY